MQRKAVALVVSLLVGAVMFTGYTVITGPVPYQEVHEEKKGVEQVIEPDAPLLSEKEATEEKEKRRKVLNEWIVAAKEVAVKSKDPQALQLVGLLEEVAIVAKPVEYQGKQASIFLEEGKEKLWVGFVPLLKDEKLPKSWQELRDNKNVGAAYSVEAGTMTVKEGSATSKAWKGMIILHEGDHALTMKTSPYDWTDQKTFCFAEKNTHEFQNRIALAYGGERYANLLAGEMTRMKLLIQEHKLAPWKEFPQRNEYTKGLDEVFGKALSKEERDMRETHFWIHAIFSLFDMEKSFSEEEKEDRKAKFLFTLYVEGGVLKPQG